MICPERTDPELLAAVADIPNRPPLVGWVGHALTAQEAPSLALFDVLSYTDTAYIDQHKAFGIASAAAYVPHAADLTLAGVSFPASKSQPVFVGGACAYRRSILFRRRTACCSLRSSVGRSQQRHTTRVHAAAHLSAQPWRDLRSLYKRAKFQE